MIPLLLLGLAAQGENDWEALLGALRQGGAWDQADRPEGRAFAEIKGLGSAALPHLAKFIGHSDLLTAKAAVRVLNELTGRQSQLPTQATQGAIQAEWEAWIRENAGAVASVDEDPYPFLVCPLEEEAARKAVARLSADDPADRAEARTVLLHAGLLHHDLLQASLDTRDAEAREALREILGRAEGRRAHFRRLAASGDWVRQQCLRIAREQPDGEGFRARLTGFLGILDLLRCTPEGVLRRSRDLARLHALAEPDRADWAAVVQAWLRTLAEPDLPLESKQAIHRALEQVQDGSVAGADRLRRQALREVEAGRRTEALRLLDAARPRFAGTEGGARIDRVREALAP